MHKTYHKSNIMLAYIDSAQSNVGSQFEVLVDIDYRIIRKFTETDEEERHIFFFHKDHLGSSTQISDMSRRVIHHIEYMPSGELFAEQRDYWHTPFKFNGKELDEETGYYYYGARYYTPEVGIWLSVDPLSDKYPSLSPFMYCAGNPVVLVDPDGREIYITGDAAGEAFGQLQNKTKLKLTIDNKGKVEAKGIAWTKKDRMIKKASKDKDVRVNIEANNSESFEGWDGKEREYENNIGGAYGGSVVSDDGKIDSYQYVNPSRLGTMDKDVGDEKTGGYMLHEVAEGYYSGILGMKTKGDKIVGGSNYDEAHRRANKISGGGYLHIEERGKFPAFFFKNNIPLNYHTGITNDRKVGDKYKRTKE